MTKMTPQESEMRRLIGHVLDDIRKERAKKRPLKTELEPGYLVELKGNPVYNRGCYCTVLRMKDGLFLLTPVGMISMRDYNQLLKHSPIKGGKRNAALDIVAVYGRNETLSTAYEFSPEGRKLIWAEY